MYVMCVKLRVCVCVRVRWEWMQVYGCIMYMCVCLVFVDVYIYVYRCVCIDVWRVCLYMWVCICVYLWVSVYFSCNARTCHAIRIWICSRYGLVTLAIQKPTHGMIQRFVSVRAVKTRQRFGYKIASFHVSICSCIISLFTVVCSIYMLLILFHVIIWYIWPVWLPVPFHVTSVTVHLIYLVDLSYYQCQFMCWYFVAVGLGLVLKNLRLWLNSTYWLARFTYI